MVKYYDIVVRFVMRDCGDARTAVQQLIRLLPRRPDESTMNVESWEVESVCCSDFTEYYSTGIDENALEQLVYAAEEVA